MGRSASEYRSLCFRLKCQRLKRNVNLGCYNLLIRDCVPYVRAPSFTHRAYQLNISLLLKNIIRKPSLEFFQWWLFLQGMKLLSSLQIYLLTRIVWVLTPLQINLLTETIWDGAKASTIPYVNVLRVPILILIPMLIP